MLLTSSQVSVAVSSGVVVFFTSALFLSGYAIQQRTVRELRASILKPHRRPEQLVFLPDRFKKMTTELEDGSIVAVDPDDDYPPLKQETYIEIKQTLPDEENTAETSPEAQDQSAPEQLSAEALRGSQQKSVKSEKFGPQQKPMSAVERRRRIKEELQKLSQGTERGYWQPRLW